MPIDWAAPRTTIYRMALLRQYGWLPDERLRQLFAAAIESDLADHGLRDASGQTLSPCPYQVLRCALLRGRESRQSSNRKRVQSLSLPLAVLRYTRTCRPIQLFPSGRPYVLGQISSPRILLRALGCARTVGAPLISI